MEEINPKETINKSEFQSTFNPSLQAHNILKFGKILAENEAPHDMISRMVKTIFDIERSFNTSEEEILSLKQKFGYYADNGYCVMSTPVMTNAGRYPDKPLSACTVPPINLRGDLMKTKQIINEMHEEGMGTGFNLDDASDPISMLKFLNEVAVEGANSGREDRPVGNMAVMSISNPHILEFISIKNGASERGESWKFNLSVNITASFMSALNNEDYFTLDNGDKISAKHLFSQICQNANSCADPGLLFMERLNQDNPTPIVGNYTSTAPCAEVGLTPGESCQFGYINLAKFIEFSNNQTNIDWKELESMTKIMTRALDNALEVSLTSYSQEENRRVMSMKRKIGIGVCGLADLLTVMKLPYDSDEARTLSRNIISFINYISKCESHNLAKDRGSFGAMKFKIGCRYNEENGFIEDKYIPNPSGTVGPEEWENLGKLIRTTGFLRNASTIALPPTGRSGLVIDASTGIEPLFTLISNDREINPNLRNHLLQLGLFTKEIQDQILKTGKLSDIEQIPADIKKIYQTATEIDPEGHLKMVSSIQPVIDESISKTVNMPSDSMPTDVAYVYKKAYEYGLKGITIYRDGSLVKQPKELVK